MRGLRLNKFYLFAIITSLLAFKLCLPQERIERFGKITYKSSQNIYVQFDSTNGIKPGDTLFIKVKGKLTPAVAVNFISSRSCAGADLNSNNLKLGDELIAFVPAYKTEMKKMAEKDSISIGKNFVNQDLNVQKKSEIKMRQLPYSSGRVSIQSYSNLIQNDPSANSQRWRYTFRFDADNIQQSGFSFSTYANFNYSAAEWKLIKNKPWNYLKVYDLSVGYDWENNTKVRLGRYLNPRIANISSVDGLQLQTKLSNYFGGLVIGSRPNFITFGFEPKLLEYGGYLGRVDSLLNGFMENTIGFFQQMNNSKTDRRFAYFQHNSSIFRGFNLFLSSEVDLFSVEKGVSKNKFSLTSLFLSSRYSPTSSLSFTLSYDARKNVIYYESFKTFLDSIIENETRQGLRVGTNLRLFNSVFVGLNAGYRFLNKDKRPSKNFNGFAAFSQIPWIEISPTFSYSQLSSSYINGKIYEISISKFLSAIDFSISAALTYMNYEYIAEMLNVNQKSFRIDLSGIIYGPLSFSINYEGVFEKKLSFTTLLTGISYRF